jgi:hypothetical protein
MLLFSINRSRGYENPSLDIIVIELCSTGGCPLEEAREHCFQIQSAISVVILISFQCYCGECSGYIAVILPLLAFYLCSVITEGKSMALKMKPQDAILDLLNKYNNKTRPD